MSNIKGRHHFGTISVTPFPWTAGLALGAACPIVRDSPLNRSSYNSLFTSGAGQSDGHTHQASSKPWATQKVKVTGPIFLLTKIWI
jgi:hypothetical protein